MPRLSFRSAASSVSSSQQPKKPVPPVMNNRCPASTGQASAVCWSTCSRSFDASGLTAVVIASKTIRVFSQPGHRRRYRHPPRLQPAAGSHSKKRGTNGSSAQRIRKNPRPAASRVRAPPGRSTAAGIRFHADRRPREQSPSVPASDGALPPPRHEPRGAPRKPDRN